MIVDNRPIQLLIYLDSTVCFNMMSPTNCDTAHYRAGSVTSFQQ